MMDKIISAAMKGHLPEADIRYVWHIEWLYEEDNNPSPIGFDHPSPADALNHLIKLWNDPRTLVHMSVSRRNA